MAVLTIPRKKNTDILSGEFNPFASFDWRSFWRKESENKKIKETTEGFIGIEVLFAFLQSRNCVIANKEEITDFLNNHVSIVDYLYEAPEIIKGKFGEANLNLELFFDPEIEGDEGELFLNIETDLSPKAAHDKLNEIDEEWLLNIRSADLIFLNLNLRFI